MITTSHYFCQTRTAVTNKPHANRQAPVSSLITAHLLRCLVLPMLVLALDLQAQSPNSLIAFNVDMSAQVAAGAFDRATDVVAARGSFNGWGTFYLTNITVDGNSNLYTGAIVDTTDPNGGVLQFKYWHSDFMAPNGGWELPANGGGNRAAKLPAIGGTLALPTVFFSDAGTPVTNAVTFQVNMAQAINLGGFIPGASTVYARGSFNSFDTSASMTNDPTILTTNQFGLVSSNVYVTTVDVVASPNAAQAFRYYIDSPSNWETPSSANAVGGNRFMVNAAQTLPIVFFSDAAYAPVVTNNVQLQVDMTVQLLSGAFDPTQDTLDLRGSFNSWSGGVNTCTNNPNAANTNLYSTVITIIDGVGATEEFKFAYAGANGTNWETLALTTPQISGNRFFVLADTNAQVVPAVAFSDVAVAIINQPADQVGVTGDSISFTASAAGAAPLSYQWQFGGTNLVNTDRVSGSQSNTITLAPVLLDDGGNYQVIVTNAYGATTSSVARLTVLKAAPVITWADPPAITYPAALSSGQLNATSSVPGSFVYAPANSTVLDAGTNTLSVTFTPTDTTNYNTAVGSVSLVVLPASLTVTASNATRPYGQINPPFGGTIAGIQNGDNITVTYAAPTATLTSPPGTYSIVPDLADPDTRLPNYTVITNCGTLMVTCPAITLSSTTLPDGVAGSAYTQNLGGAGGAAPYTFDLTAGSLPPELKLSRGGTLTGIPAAAGTNTFSITATDANGCSGTQAYVLAVSGTYPTITGQPQNCTNVAGTTAAFTVSADGAMPLGYQWFKNETNTIAGATNLVLSLTNVQTTDIAGYSVLVTNAYGSATSSVVTLTVLFPPVIVQQPQNRAAVVGGTAQFSVAVTGNTNRAYQWRLGETEMLGRTNSLLVLTGIGLSDFAGYRVVVSNPSGSTTSHVAHLTVAQQPELGPPQFNASTLYLAIPTEVGPVYVVEYKTALDDLLWQELTFLNGTGGTLTVTDNNPTNSARFYRIRMR